MKEIFNLLAILAALAIITPALAVGSYYEAASGIQATGQSQSPALSITDYLNSRYIGSQPLYIALSGVNPAVFDSVAFVKEPGGLTSGELYTPSMKDFLRDDRSAGVSKVIKKGAKIGLVNWP